MVTVERYDTYTHSRGYKTFATKEEAEEWLKSDDVEEDIDFGCSFKIIEEDK